MRPWKNTFSQPQRNSGKLSDNSGDVVRASGQDASRIVPWEGVSNMSCQEETQNTLEIAFLIWSGNALAYYQLMEVAGERAGLSSLLILFPP